MVDEKLLQLWKIHPQAVDWIEGITESKWLRAYDKEGQCWGHMAINLTEIINSVLKGVRFLPVLGLVKMTFYRLNYYWVECARTSHAQMVISEVLFEDAHEKLATCIHKAS